jgi:spermidine synthase
MHGERRAARMRSGSPAVLAAAAVAILAVLFATAALLLRQQERTLFEAASDFGGVRVTEDGRGIRRLYTGDGRAVQTAMHPERRAELHSPYTQVAMVGLALSPPDGRMLFVGLGGGAMPSFVQHVQPEARLEAAEIDSVVIDAAIRFFGLRTGPALRVHAGDGRAFIEAAPPSSWDVIFLDAFSDDAVPYTLATREFLQGVRSSLAPDGVVVSNLWQRSPLHADMVTTYLDVFEHVAVVQVPQRLQQILLASRGRALTGESVLAATRALQGRLPLGFDLAGMVEGGYGVPARTGRVLTDPSTDQPPD